jgi:hypothetical protein
LIENEEATLTHHTPHVRVVTASSCAAAVPTQPAAARVAATAAEPGSRRGWASVGAVALGAFVIVMTETLPVGLLPQIAGGLRVSLGLAGLMVLVPGFSAAVSAPLFFLGSGRFNRRSVIVVLGLTVLVSNAAVAVAPNFVLVLRQPRRLASHFRHCGGGDTACRGCADGRAAGYSARRASAPA